VLTFRIANAYLANPITLEHIENSLTEMPPVRADHVFRRIGRSRRRTHGRTDRVVPGKPGCDPRVRSVISSPSRFFKALEEARLKLPRVTGDLQPHAVGCYSIYRPVKLAVRQAEYRLAQAEILRNKLGARRTSCPHSSEDGRMFVFITSTTHWRNVHSSAYPQVLAQLGEALSLADENLQVGLRSWWKICLPPHQRIIAYNPSHVDFEALSNTNSGWIGYPGTMQYPRRARTPDS